MQPADLLALLRYNALYLTDEQTQQLEAIEARLDEHGDDDLEADRMIVELWHDVFSHRDGDDA